MERVAALIQKLVDQHRQGLPAEQLLPTVQLLQLELSAAAAAPATSKSGKVAVVMPAGFAAMPSAYAEASAAPLAVSEPQPRISIAEKDKKYLPADAVVKKEEPKPAAPAEKKPAPVTLAKEHYGVAAHEMDEAPTLMQHAPAKLPATPTRKELHESLAEKKESLNDKLKENKKELSHHLSSGPIKDLRKGVGINDKFLFVNELFRGDEAMYERSIKTINAFHILPEAEYWINRELKVKLGWNDSKDVVQQFYAIVRRRFS